MTSELEKKVTQSLKLIEALSTGTEIVAHSGGKDSVVLADLVQRALGSDPAGTLSFLKANYPDIVFDKPETNFGELVRKKGYPTRMTRFCCEKLKERVGKGQRVFEGMRADESGKRSKNALFKLDAKEIINRELDLSL